MGTDTCRGKESLAFDRGGGYLPRADLTGCPRRSGQVYYTCLYGYSVGGVAVDAVCCLKWTAAADYCVCHPTAATHEQLGERRYFGVCGLLAAIFRCVCGFCVVSLAHTQSVMRES